MKKGLLLAGILAFAMMINIQNVGAAEGDVLWATQFSPLYNNYIQAATVDNNGNVVVTGDFDNNFFVAKFSSNGVHIWNKSIGIWDYPDPEYPNIGFFLSQGHGKDVITTADGNIYAVAGHLVSEITHYWPYFF